MANLIQAIRGMHDILPHETPLWQHAESIIREVLSSYGYSEIRLPILEKTELFKRSIGEVTDIVEKEMYTFEDRNGDSLTLRPEGTAGCLRACLEHGLLHNQIQRLWYYGAMYRHERPQKGRYRQFIQLGVETYGMQSPEADAELLILMHRLWQRLGIRDKVSLQLNSLGTSQERFVYRSHLIKYLTQYETQLDEDSVRRLNPNPLRILDSKNPAMQSIISNAPVLMDYLGEDSKNHFESITAILTDLNIDYEINTRLVRGLDYYCNTVFEWVTTELGSQGTVCAGGRYDGLIAQLGGKENHAVGFAMGMERLLALMENVAIPLNNPLDIYFIRVGENAQQMGLIYAEKIRDALPHLKLQLNIEGGSFKSQFKKADKSGADYALIIGDDEVANNTISIKALRHEAPQHSVSLEHTIIFLIDKFNKK